MPLYAVEYQDRTTKYYPKRDQVFALNQNDLRDSMLKQGKRIVAAKPMGDIRKVYHFKLAPDQVLGYIDQLMMLIKGGKSITEAAARIARQRATRKVKFMSAIIAERLTQFPVGEAFSTFPDVFPAHVAGILEAGAKSGSLEQVLEQIREYVRESQKLKAAVSRGTTYPKVVCVVMLMVVGVAFGYIVPTFVKVFKEFRVKLPTITQSLFDTSRFVQNHWLLLLIGIVSVMVALKYGKRNPAFKRFMDRVVMKIPHVNTSITYVDSARFCGTLGVLVGSGMNAQDALATCQKVVGNTVHEEAIRDASVYINKGKIPISAALARAEVFPNVVIANLETAEENGTLESQCRKLHEYYAEEARNRINKAVDAMSPVLIVIMVSLGGYIVAGLLLPIFSLALSISSR